MKQNGAALLVTVLVIVTVAAFAVVVAATQSGDGVQATDANADSHQVLLVADSALERQLKRFATGTACGALGDDPGTGPVEASHSITDLSTIGLGTTSYTITLADGFATDFAGAALTASQCRIPVTARSNTSNVSRSVHAIVDRNLLDGVDNPTFDNPLTGATPGGWTAINPAAAFAANGGPDGTAPSCRRSAWTARNNPAGAANNRRATATAAVDVTLAAGSTTTITFYRRVITRANDCGALPAAGPAALPAACGAGVADSTVCFQLVGTGGAGTWTVGSNAGTSGAGVAACPSTFNPCATNYPGYPTKLTLNVTMTGAATVTSFVYWLQLQNGGRKELFLDNVEVTNDSFVGAAHVRVWRDCSTAVNPASCT
jgi:hypothetical protein